MFDKKDFKYIAKRVIIGLTIAFILFNINKCNVKALVFKGNHDVNFNTTSYSGTLSPNGLNWVADGVFTSPLVVADYPYDFIGIKMNRFNFVETNYVDIANPNLNPVQSYTFQCTNGSNYCSNAIINPTTASVPTNLLGSIDSGDITISANLYGDNIVSPCWFDSSISDNIIVCPLDKSNTKYFHFIMIITVNGYKSIDYYIDYSNLRFFYNYDSTEIVNGLLGVQSQQENTTTAINNTLNTINDTNTTTSSASGNNALSGFNSSISTGIDNSVDATSLYTLLTNFTNQLSDTTCQPIVLPIPYTNENLTLPCLGTEFASRIPIIWNVYQLIILGAFALAMWQNATEFVFKVMDPYYAGANNLPIGGGK